MFWGEVFVGITLLTLFTYKNKACLVAVVGLIMWTGLEKVIYQYGVIETDGTQLITFIFFVYSVLAWYFFKGWLFVVLMLSALLTMLWTTSSVTDPYTFKAGKNILYGADLVSVWLNYYSSRRLALG